MKYAMIKWGYFLAFMALTCTALLMLGGCSSLNDAGVSTYSVEPMILAGEAKPVCCRVMVRNGKEIAYLKAHIEKRGANYTVDLEEKGVKAFTGQAISASAVPAITTVLPQLIPK